MPQLWHKIFLLICNHMVHMDDRHCSVCNNLLGPSGITSVTGNDATKTFISTFTIHTTMVTTASVTRIHTTTKHITMATATFTNTRTQQPWSADAIKNTPPRGGFITGRQPARENIPAPPTPDYLQEQSDLHTGVPQPSATGYPSGQAAGQAAKPPIPTVSLHSSESSGYDMAGDDSTFYGQAGVKQKAARPGKQTWAQSGIKDAKRQSSPLLLSLIIILSLGLIAFVTYNFGLIQGPIDVVKGLISKIELPSSIPFLSSPSDNSTEKDTTPPVISNIMVANVTDASAILTWATDQRLPARSCTASQMAFAAGQRPIKNLLPAIL